MATDRIVTAGRDDEVGRNEPSSLVEQLEERMLPVGAGLPPDDRSGRVLDPLAVP